MELRKLLPSSGLERACGVTYLLLAAAMTVRQPSAASITRLSSSEQASLAAVLACRNSFLTFPARFSATACSRLANSPLRALTSFSSQRRPERRAASSCSCSRGLTPASSGISRHTESARAMDSVRRA